MIREATRDDIPAMLALGEAMHGESRYARFPWNVEKVTKLLQALVDSEDGLALIAEQDGEPVGGFIGAACDHWCTDARTSSDFALFVRPDHRGGMLGLRLLRRYAAWARSRGVADDLICTGITTGIDVAASTRLFELAGFKTAGPLFVFGGNAHV